MSIILVLSAVLMSIEIEYCMNHTIMIAEFLGMDEQEFRNIVGGHKATIWRYSDGSQLCKAWRINENLIVLCKESKYGNSATYHKMTPDQFESWKQKFLAW